MRKPIVVILAVLMLSSASAQEGASALRASGPPEGVTAKTRVPQLTGFGLSEAKKELRERGLHWRIRFETSETESETVVKTRPESGDRVEAGTVVTLYLPKAKPDKVQLAGVKTEEDIVESSSLKWVIVFLLQLLCGILLFLICRERQKK